MRQDFLRNSCNARGRKDLDSLFPPLHFPITSPPLCVGEGEERKRGKASRFVVDIIIIGQIYIKILKFATSANAQNGAKLTGLSLRNVRSLASLFLELAFGMLLLVCNPGRASPISEIHNKPN
ncbi:hypothetical protein TWF225_011233 [Orbilia oligospora]|nr:hypothetical protein TWF225_011233 [Orbilia oligospora]KAF3247252.1 hypothetical protein TWF217_009664 [Orbilia oligospora]KAF3256283.1 hypothetical protein TWF128_005352 [Orbilia oligospora]KAF3280653.1 hypothetical protein TWF132_011729 [Orbilia oligospora]